MKQYIQPAILVIEIATEGICWDGSNRVQGLKSTSGMDLMLERETKMGIYTDDFGNTWVDGAK